MRTLFPFLFLIGCTLQPCLGQKNYQKEFYQVDSILESHYQVNTPGVAVTILKDGIPLYMKYVGMADLEQRIPISDSTVFHIASVSKQFTAFLALKLEQEGKLSMEDDLRKHLPELSHLPFKIKLSQLANHTHGLPNYIELAHVKGIDSQDPMSHKEVVDLLLNLKTINFKPGDTYEYNNTGFVLLSEVIARVEGKAFQQILKDRIFDPLGMAHSLAVDSPELIVKNRARSYRMEKGLFVNYDLNLKALGSSGISTTISDLAKWAAFYQNPAPESLELLVTMEQHTQLNSGTRIGYGLGLETRNYKGIEVVFHGGGDVGYRAYLLHVPQYRWSIAILGNNNDFTPLKVVYKIVDLLLKDQLTDPLPPKKTTYTTRELHSFEGTYAMFPGTYYNIIAEKDTLYFQAYGTADKAPLPVLGDGEFLFPYIPTAKFSFYEEGFIFHIADFTYDCKRIGQIGGFPEEHSLADYTGLYKNEELNTVYELVVENDVLTATHSFNENMVLRPLDKDRFYSTKNFFGQLDFIRNPLGEVTRFKVAGQNIRNLEFTKIDAQ